ncbi:MAG: hypothetical protein G01um101477_668 [Candidatus Doudnabacteria bacterium Gr01-1014_77]|uniref:KH domain-containing protein n=1 Tax=Candidatus Doudnabacteria bacterium Gr01-1014_77 TaxID=2017133 RepID=A0A554J991_9BACT|nr:MAG: hypothetical protein G01um101477_668 [Candidatus Doudnabacteria bacterium Gr01-1014_77]
MNLDDNQENQDPVQEIKTAEIAALIKEALEIMGVDSRVGVEQNVQGFTFNISSPDSNLLIGQRGANLHALQTLIHSIAYKKYGPTDRFTLDVDDYKKKREWYLRETAICFHGFESHYLHQLTCWTKNNILMLVSLAARILKAPHNSGVLL